MQVIRVLQPFRFSVGEHDTRLWRIVHHYVEDARQNANHCDVRHVGMDETSSKKGHNYVSVFVDIERSKVLYATEGKDASTVQRFRQDLSKHGGDPEAVEEMCCDMSPAFISGIEKNFPSAELTFDKFHLTKIDALVKSRISDGFVKSSQARRVNSE